LLRFSLLILFLPILASPQEDTFGKSEAQILAMGQQKWNDFYQAKAGPSTASMARMNEIFGDAAKHRNDRLLKHAAAASRRSAVKLRKLLADYANHAVEIGENIVGGGTMWIPVYANIEADSELVLFGVLGGKAQNSPPTTVSGVEKWVGQVGKAIAKTHADHDADAYFKYPAAKASLAGMRTDLTQIISVAKHLDRKNSDRILGFCINYARTAKDEWN
jgi:hypothetical protein